MSKRLQVLLDEKELREIQRIARRQRLTVADWVRQALRAAKRREPTGDAARKLKAIRSAARHAFPTGPVEDMIRDIDRGYGPLATAVYAQAREDIRRFLANPAANAPKSSALPQPPGAPIGMR